MSRTVDNVIAPTMLPYIDDNHQLDQLFCIAWVNTTRKRSGRGTRVMSQDEAEHLADELNEEYPWIYHWAAPVEAGEGGANE